MRTLNEIKVVDLAASVIDEKNSNPALGEYSFISKKYIGPLGSGPWDFTWERYSAESHYRELNDAKSRGYFPVKVGVDPYWPEFIVPNSEGYYQKGDLVLVKGRAADALEKLADNVALSRGARTAKLNAFRAEARNSGVDITDEAMERMSKI